MILISTFIRLNMILLFRYSGPKRYDFSEGVWVYKHDGKLMHDLLTTEISEALGEHIDFTICSYGSR